MYISLVSVRVRAPNRFFYGTFKNVISFHQPFYLSQSTKARERKKKPFPVQKFSFFQKTKHETMSAAQQQDNVNDIVNKRFLWKEGDPQFIEPEGWSRFMLPNGSVTFAPPQSDRVAVMRLAKRKAMLVDGASVKPYLLTAQAARDDLQMKVNDIVDITGYGHLRMLTSGGFRTTAKHEATGHIPQALNLALQYKNRTLLGDVKSSTASHSPSQSPSEAALWGESLFGTNQDFDAEATFQDVMDGNQNDSDACSYGIGNYNQQDDATLPRSGSDKSDKPSTGFGQGFGQGFGSGSVPDSSSDKPIRTFECDGDADSVTSPDYTDFSFDDFGPPVEYSTKYNNWSTATEYDGYNDDKFGSGNASWGKQRALPRFGASDGNQSPHSMTQEEVNRFAHHPKGPRQIAKEEFNDRAWGNQYPDAFDANKYREREQQDLDDAIAASLQDFRFSLPDTSWDGASDDFVEVSDSGFPADHNHVFPNGTPRP
jgi:hypothetical protein